MSHLRHRRLIYLSVAAALLTMGLKFTSYWLTGSVGLLSDAVESIVNLIAALVALFAVWYAAQPADQHHPYGHEKVEYFSSGFEGALIILAACAIAWHAIDRLIHPGPIEQLGLGITISLIAAGINGVVGWQLIRVGRAEQAIILEADGHHLFTDVWTSVGVALGLVIVMTTNWLWLDAVIGLCVAAHILFTGGKILKRSFDGLMDTALPEEDLARLRAIIEAKLQPGMTYHALRTRQSGTRRHADFHLLVPGQMSVTDAHAVADALEAALVEQWPRMIVTTHLEPIEDEASWEEHPYEPPPQGQTEPKPDAASSTTSALSTTSGDAALTNEINPR